MNDLDELDEEDRDRRGRRLETLDELVLTGRDLGVCLVGYCFTGASDGLVTIDEVTPSGRLEFLGRVPFDD